MEKTGLFSATKKEIKTTDMGGVLVGIVANIGGLGAKKICDFLGAPIWFAKVLFIIATIYGMYHLVIHSMPDASAWSIGFTTLGVSSGILVIGLIYLSEQEENNPTKK